MSVATANVEVPAKVSRLAVFWQSQIGKKSVSAVTGIILSLFVVGHLVGNLQVFEGLEKLNAYAHFLQSATELLWPVRVVLLAAVILHATAGIQLYLASRAARPVPYRVPLAASSSVGSRTMIWSGLLVLAFVVYHILDLTLGAAAVHAGFVPGNAFLNVVTSFRSWGKVIFYAAALVGLGFHLSHGLYSLLQSLGFRSPLWTPRFKQAAVVVGVILAVFYIFIPAGVVVGLIHL